MTQNFPSPHHQRLNRLAGLWDTTITTINANGIPGDSSRATDNYTWMPNSHFLVHDVDADMGGSRVQSTEIFGVDTATGDFYTRSYDPDGSTNDFTARIAGDLFTIDGTRQRFAGQFSADGNTIEGQWTQLTDGRWHPFVHIVLQRKS